MNMFRIDFEEIYRRHLCRHGQFGVNVLHLIAVVGVYLSLFGFVMSIVPAESYLTKTSVLISFLMVYLLVLSFNVPRKVFAATFVIIVGLVALNHFLPALPFWSYPILMLAFHQFQQLHHHWYPLHRDMSEFSARYRKGLHLFLLLSLYELPVLLRYLLLGQKDWVR